MVSGYRWFFRLYKSIVVLVSTQSSPVQQLWWLLLLLHRTHHAVLLEVLTTGLTEDSLGWARMMPAAGLLAEAVVTDIAAGREMSLQAMTTYIASRQDITTHTCRGADKFRGEGGREGGRGERERERC